MANNVPTGRIRRGMALNDFYTIYEAKTKTKLFEFSFLRRKHFLRIEDNVMVLDCLDFLEMAHLFV